MGEARIEHEGGWTEERVGTLKTMWADGKSATEIMTALGGGLTRSAVLGKVSRLKLEKRRAVGAYAQRRPKAAKPNAMAIPARPAVVLTAVAATRGADNPYGAHLGRKRLPSPPPDPETDVGVDVTHRIGLMALTQHTCRWPVGSETGAAQMFCGCRKGSDAGPYCPEHARRAEVHR